MSRPEPDAWHHCRWLEPHNAVPREGTIGPIRAQGGRLGAGCVTCGEAILPTDASTEARALLTEDR